MMHGQTKINPNSIITVQYPL